MIPYVKPTMDALDMLKDNLNFAHRTFLDARNGTDAQLHFVPENGSHSIAPERYYHHARCWIARPSRSCPHAT
jgi:hypothetical protein